MNLGKIMIWLNSHYCLFHSINLVSVNTESVSVVLHQLLILHHLWLQLRTEIFVSVFIATAPGEATILPYQS